MNNLPISELLLGAGSLLAVCIVCLIYLMGKISQISQETQNFCKVRINFLDGSTLAVINTIWMGSVGVISMLMMGSGLLMCAYKVVRQAVA